MSAATAVPIGPRVVPADESCSNCQWMRQRATWMECRFDSPVAHVGWPRVQADDWCGNHDVVK